MRLDQYSKTKNQYAISYLGRCGEYVLQLKALRPFLENKFPDMEISLICRDLFFCLLEGSERVFKASDLDESKFVRVERILYDGTRFHPVERLLKEWEVEDFYLELGNSPKTTRCVIITEGNIPTVSLPPSKIEKLEKIAKEGGYDVELDQDVTLAGLVMGVESPGLYQAALAGIETGLVPTGVGTRLYRRMFPEGRILQV
jgi:hypothetical protein